MRRLVRYMLVAVISIVLVPAVAVANAPNPSPNAAAFISHHSTCGDMIVGPGATFWIGDQQYLIERATLVFDGGGTLTYNFGQKTGLGATIECTGYFPPSGSSPGYTVTSYDVLVP
jgi:hypothetical protein